MQPLAQPPLQLRPEISELSALTTYVEAFAAEHDMGPSDTYAFSLAAEELFANTIRHSHPPATSVEFSLTMNDGMVMATYSDDSSEFDPTLQAAPDTTLPVSEREFGGLGIHFMRKSMQQFGYSRAAGRNVVTFGRTITKHR
jgi:serine/threonine-protein kinase RsbW